ncbi:hypothetical protein B5S28_g4545 [[Candida] boidinii]|nr:hypothetical protein B5S28_g4545 [[Candida] boidinii]OWB63906.1 hypothetical protein B5S29_g4921 [[Candida] boidinii]
MTLDNNDLFLGFDLSTQQLKVIASYSNLKNHSTYRVDFDSELSHYGIKKGVISIEKTGEIYAPVEMWIEALDLVFNKMKLDNFPFGNVKGMSGSCQQHGSVYWSSDAPNIFKNLTSDKPLKDQLCPNAFTFQTSPNWQDHSTGPELTAFEDSVGGCHELAKITGSRAHYRFTGPQIRKLATRKDPVKYHQTYRISLISSFLASLLCGEIAKIDEADGCGMNLYDIQNSEYHPDLLAVCAGVHPKIDNVSEDEKLKGVEELLNKLGPVEPIGSKKVGQISNYFISKYGFNKDCEIFPFTGDNLATILALPLATNDILISMGTSTTVLLVTNQYKPSENYHIFKHPTIENHYMGMLCYCNGSLAREKIRDLVNDKFNIEDSKSWDKFNELLDIGKPLNNNEELGIYFPLGEIIPNAAPQTRRYRFNIEKNILEELTGDSNNDSWEIEKDANSIVESQALSCRLRAGPMLASTAKSDTEDESEFNENEKKILKQLSKFGSIESDGTIQSKQALISRPNKIFYVGGASKNLSIIKKFANVFGALKGNYKIDLSDACALGGSFKATWSRLLEDKEIDKDYGNWLFNTFNWDEVENFEAKNEWNDYVDGVGILSLAEKTLTK